MKTIYADDITRTVARLCIQANRHLPPDVTAALDRARGEEPWPLAKNTLDLLWDNLELADSRQLPSARTRGWPASSWSWGRRSISRGTSSRPSTRGCARAMGRATSASPSWPTPCAG